MLKRIMNSRANRQSDRQRADTEELHRRFAGLVYEHCLRILGDKGQAEDAVQETFISAYRSWASFKYGDTPLPWLYRIATNASLKIIRSRRGIAYSEHQIEIADGRDTGIRIDARRILERLTQELDERGLEILVAYYISGMNQKEIAKSLGISRRAVVKRLGALRKRVGHLFAEDHSHG